jgi:hypothetical protein
MIITKAACIRNSVVSDTNRETTRVSRGESDFDSYCSSATDDKETSRPVNSLQTTPYRGIGRFKLEDKQ